MINFKTYNTRQPNSGPLGLEYYTEQEIRAISRINNSFVVFGGLGIGITPDGYWLIDDCRDKPALHLAPLPLMRLETETLYKLRLWFTHPQEVFAFTERFKGRTITWKEYYSGKVKGILLLYSNYSYNLVKTQKP